MERILVDAYALSLLQLGKDNAKLDDIKQHLDIFQSFIDRDEKFYNFLCHPCINKQEKKAIINDIFRDMLNQIVLNYLSVLIDKNRIAYFKSINEEYQQLYRIDKGIKFVKVESAIKMSNEQILRLKQQIIKKCGSAIEMDIHINKELVAGIRIKIDDYYIDMSVKGQLEKLKTDILNNEEEVIV